MRKKAVSMLLALCMVLTLMPTTAWAGYHTDEATVVPVTGGNIYIEDNKVVDADESVTAVTIPASVTYIESGAFEGCSSLTSIDVAAENKVFSSDSGVLFDKAKQFLALYPPKKSGDSYTIPNSVTAIVDNAFAGCSNLTSVVIPEGVTTIGDSVFTGCSSLTSVVMPASVTDIGSNVFEGCSGMTSAGPIGGNYNYQFGWTDTIPRNAFGGRSSLTSITLPEGVTTIGVGAFEGCSSLTSVVIPASVTYIESGAFEGCNSLTSIDVDAKNEDFSSNNGVLYRVVSYDEEYILLRYPPKKSGNSYIIPDNVVAISDGAFEGCSGLTNVTIPNSVDSIGNNAFEGCSGLTNVTIPDSVDFIGLSMFKGCSSLTSVAIPDGVTEIGSSMFEGCNSLPSVTIPSNVTSIEQRAFKNCSSLASVAIPSSVTTIDSYAFEDCNGLKNVTIPGSVTSIEYGAFRDCSSLTSVTIPEGVTSIGNSAFYGCSNLMSVAIPDSVTIIGDLVFSYCNKLKDVYYTGTEEEWNAIAVQKDYNEPLFNANIYYGFTGEIPVPTLYTGTLGTDVNWKLDANGTLTVSGSGKMYDSYEWENGIQDLIQTIIIEDGVTNIGSFVFDSCKNIRSVTISGSVKKIVNGAFSRHRSLTRLTLLDGVEEIEWWAFSGCSALTCVTIPKSLRIIRSDAFRSTSTDKDGDYANDREKEDAIYDKSYRGNSNLRNVYYAGTETEWKAMNIERVNDELLKAKIHYSSNGPDDGQYVITMNAADTLFTAMNVTKMPYIHFTYLTDTEGKLPDGFLEGAKDGGYTNHGWYTAEIGGSKVEEGHVFTGDTTIYAHWTKDDTSKGYTVTFDANGGTVQNTSAQTGADGKLTELPTPTRNGYTFNGWYTDKSGGTQVTTATAFTQNTTVYAQWKESSATTDSISGTCGENLTWNLDSNGTLTISGSGAMVDYEYEESPWCTNSSIKKIIIESGVTSIGSSAFENCSGLTSVSIPAGVTSIGISAFDGCDKLINVYYSGSEEVWEKITIDPFNTPLNRVNIHYNSTGPAAGVYTVTFNANSGTVSTTSATTGVDGKLTTLPTPTRNGYTFDGWYTAVSGGSEIKAEHIFTADLTIYAHWTQKTTNPGTTTSGGGGGGGAVAPTHTVSAPAKVENGSVSVSPSNASKGSKVTITMKPDDGYVAQMPEILDASGKKVDVTDAGNGTYTFLMPDSAISIKASFAKQQMTPTNPETPKTPTFTDVPTGAWFADAVKTMQERKLMTGTSDTEFSPTVKMSRAMIVTVLHRLANTPSGGTVTFPDVAGGQWYSEAVAWASANGIVTGTGNGFAPNGDVTREQLAAILYRYAKTSGIATTQSGDIGKFSDNENVSDWASDAMRWAVGAGIIGGTDAGTLNPSGSATRAEVATMLARFLDVINAA